MRLPSVAASLHVTMLAHHTAGSLQPSLTLCSLTLCNSFLNPLPAGSRRELLLSASMHHTTSHMLHHHLTHVVIQTGILWTSQKDCIQFIHCLAAASCCFLQRLGTKKRKKCNLLHSSWCCPAGAPRHFRQPAAVQPCCLDQQLQSAQHPLHHTAAGRAAST